MCLTIRIFEKEWHFWIGKMPKRSSRDERIKDRCQKDPHNDVPEKYNIFVT